MIEIDKDWQPALDEDGKPLPITYIFSVTDVRENPVGETRTSKEAKPATEAMLRKEAVLLAQEVSKAHSEDRPWVGWWVEVGSLNLFDNPEAVTRFEFTDLLQK